MPPELLTPWVALARSLTERVRLSPAAERLDAALRATPAPTPDDLGAIRRWEASARRVVSALPDPPRVAFAEPWAPSLPRPASPTRTSRRAS